MGKVMGNCIHANRAPFLHQKWPLEQRLYFADWTTQRSWLLSGDLSGSVQTFQMHHFGAEILPEISQARHTHVQTHKFSTMKKEGFPIKCSSSLDQNITVLSHLLLPYNTEASCTFFSHASPFTCYSEACSICQVSYQRIFEDPHSKPTGSIALRNQHCQRHAVTPLSALLQSGATTAPPLCPHVLYCLQQRLSHPVARGRNWLITVPDRS